MAKITDAAITTGAPLRVRSADQGPAGLLNRIAPPGAAARRRVTACRVPGFEPEHQSNPISNREIHLQAINSKSRSIAGCANQFGFDLIRPQPPLFRGLRISEA